LQKELKNTNASIQLLEDIIVKSHQWRGFFLNMRMARKGMTREEANEVCAKFQSLVGEKYSLDPEDNLRVQYVTVAPHDEINKYIFILQFRESGNFEAALKLDEGQLFDVVVISTIVGEKTEVLFTDLGTFLIERNMLFDLEQKTESDLTETDPVVD
jgi:hypothetical protein